MRCAQHPERIAAGECAVCGKFHCSDCLTNVANETVCLTCEPAAQQLEATSSSAEKTPNASRGRAIGTVAVVVLLAGLATLALWPNPDTQLVLPEPADPEERDELGRRCFAALESAAVALETHRAERGDYARAWEELVPELLDAAPEDPWDPSGGSLRLGQPDWDSDGIVLYSVGPDRVDNGGRLYSAETGQGDWVYRVR